MAALGNGTLSLAHVCNQSGEVVPFIVRWDRRDSPHATPASPQFENTEGEPQFAFVGRRSERTIDFQGDLKLP